ncbi:hypothetical protein HDU96_007305 [Phlyctochytrium bullatum]|nr:hypothetical protein HDU96_007305 [Phlyctochytrium bullatum]
MSASPRNSYGLEHPLQSGRRDSPSKLSFADHVEEMTPLYQFLDSLGLGGYIRTFRREGLEASPHDLSILLELDDASLNALLLEMNMKLVHKAVLTSRIKAIKAGSPTSTSTPPLFSPAAAASATPSPHGVSTSNPGLARVKNSEASLPMVAALQQAQQPVLALIPASPITTMLGAETGGANDASVGTLPTRPSINATGNGIEAGKSSDSRQLPNHPNLVPVRRGSDISLRPDLRVGPAVRRGSDVSLKHDQKLASSAFNLPGSDPVRKLYVPKWTCRQQKSAHDFFISYRVEADQTSAEKLALLLETKSKHCFIDKRCLVDGFDWEQGFLNGLERSRYIILFCSEAALEKVKIAHIVEDNMLLEWERALTLRDRNQAFVQPLLVAAYQDIQVGGKVSKALLPFKAFDLSEFPDEIVFHHLSTKTRTVRDIVAEIFKIQGIRLLPDEIEGTIPKLLDGLSRLEAQAKNREIKMEVVEIALSAREAKLLREWLRPLDMDDERSRQRRLHVQGTRQWLLKQVFDWARDHADSSRRVLWLKGAAGLGKSVMAGYVADSLQAEHLLGAAFFCKHDDTDRNDPKRVVETLAYSLSKWNPKFGRMLLKMREEEPDLLLRGAGTTRFTKLLLNPLVSLYEVGALKPVVLVVDALDEVGVRGQRYDFLKVFAQDCLRLPPCIKLFITSRPDVDIVNTFRNLSVVTFEPSQEDNLDDLTKVAQKWLVDQLRLSIEDAHPVAKKLAEMSEGVFIWLNLAFFNMKDRVLAAFPGLAGSRAGSRTFGPQFTTDVDDGPMNPLEKVYDILERLPKGLDEMYKFTLSSVYLSGPHGKPTTDIMRVLGAVVCLREPVTEAALAELMGMELALLSATLRSAHSVVSVSVRDHKVRVIHKSLKDHIINPTRSHRRFRVRLTEEHHRLGEACILILLKKLQRGTLVHSDAVAYASRYWAIHITGCLGSAPALLKQIDRLCMERLPEWLEVLSALKALDRVAVPSLRALIDWYPFGTATTPAANPNPTTPKETTGLRGINGPRVTRALLMDLLRLVLEFRAPILESPEDVYRSALPFCPSKSALTHTYSQKYPDIPLVYRGRDAQWGPCLFSLGGQGRDDCAPVLSISVAADGTRFLSGHADGSLRVWSLETGETLKVLEWDAGDVPIPKTRVEATAIGVGEGNAIMGFTTSDEGNLIMWSLELGLPLRQISLDTSSVEILDLNNASASRSDIEEAGFDPAGNSNGGDQSYHLLLMKHIRANNGWSCMTSILYSKESRVIVVAGDEKIASISLETGSFLWVRREARCQVILVRSVLFDTRYIVGAGSAIRILAADTGIPVASMEIVGHLITALAATKDGTLIAYGSDDALIRILNAEDGTTLATYSAHLGPITSLDISPDGRKIVSASSDGTVRIWLCVPSPTTASGSAHTIHNPGSSSINGGKAKLSISTDHRSLFGADQAGAPDASRANSPSFTFEGYSPSYPHPNPTPETGCHITLEGHTQGVTCVSITPDGQRVVSGSIDGTIKIWSLDTLGMAERSDKSHTDFVLCAAVSKSYLFPSGASGLADAILTNSDTSLELGMGQTKVFKDGSGTIYHRGSIDMKMAPHGTLGSQGEMRKTLEPLTEGIVQSPMSATLPEIVPSGSASATNPSASNPTIRPSVGSTMLSRKPTLDAEKRLSVSSKNQMQEEERKSDHGGDPIPESDESQRTEKTRDSIVGGFLRNGLMSPNSVMTTMKTPASQAEALPELGNGAGLGMYSAEKSGLGDPITQELIASGSRDRSVKLWHLGTGELLWTFRGHVAPVHAVAIRPDRKMVASGGSDGVIKLWSVASGQLVREFFHGIEYGGRVKSLEFTFDGMRLLSWVEDKVLVWHIPNGILENKVDGHVRLLPDHRHIQVQPDPSCSVGEKVLDILSFMEVTPAVANKAMAFTANLSEYFTISRPTTPAIDRNTTLSTAVQIVNGWVIDAEGRRVIWLPEEFRGMALTDATGKHLALFGYKGRECFVKLP